VEARYCDVCFAKPNNVSVEAVGSVTFYNEDGHDCVADIEDLCKQHLTHEFIISYLSELGWKINRNDIASFTLAFDKLALYKIPAKITSRVESVG